MKKIILLFVLAFSGCEVCAQHVVKNINLEFVPYGAVWMNTHYGFAFDYDRLGSIYLVGRTPKSAGFSFSLIFLNGEKYDGNNTPVETNQLWFTYCIEYTFNSQKRIQFPIRFCGIGVGVNNSFYGDLYLAFVANAKARYYITDNIAVQAGVNMIFNRALFLDFGLNYCFLNK